MTIKDIFKDYEKVRLEDWSCDIASGQAVSSVDGNYEKEGIRFIQGNNLTNDGFVFEPMVYIGAETHAAMPRSVVQPQDVLINIVGPPIGKICWYPEGEPEANINQAVVRVRCPDDLDYRFLTYLLRSDKYYNYFLNVKVGVRQWNISRTNCADIEIPRVPLSEQRALASRLERQMAEIDRMRCAAERQLESVREMIASLIDNEVAEMDESSGTLADVLLIEPQNGWSPVCDNKPGGIPVLTLSAVTGFQYRGDQYKLTSEAVDENAHYWIKKDDLLITRSNTRELVGHVAICDGTPEKAIYPDLVMRTRVNSEKAYLEFVHLWVMSSCARRYIIQEAQGANTTMNKISKDIVNQIPFPLHTTLEEQAEIISRLKLAINNVRSIESATERQLEAINALARVYLREIFGTFQPPDLDELPDLEDFDDSEGKEEE